MFTQNLTTSPHALMQKNFKEGGIEEGGDQISVVWMFVRIHTIAGFLLCTRGSHSHKALSLSHTHTARLVYYNLKYTHTYLSTYSLTNSLKKPYPLYRVGVCSFFWKSRGGGIRLWHLFSNLLLDSDISRIFFLYVKLPGNSCPVAVIFRVEDACRSL